MTAEYDRIGKTYSSTRAADPRITHRLIDLLGLEAESSLIDIGAGSGNYSYALAQQGFKVMAVEPSQTMREQAQPHPDLQWQAACAEALPFADNSFDGAVMTLCLHHLADWKEGIREALRVSGNGPLVIFAFDIEHKSNFWLFDYFPEFIELDRDWSATIGELKAFSEDQPDCGFECFPFPLPKDLQDHFAAAGWARPEIYLQEKYRRGISSFSRLDADVIEERIGKLEADLANGDWQIKYGELLEHDYYDRGYVFLRIGRRP